eukprot:8093758-Lingulodinium_polyedra.AAC.1
MAPAVLLGLFREAGEECVPPITPDEGACKRTDDAFVCIDYVLCSRPVALLVDDMAVRDDVVMSPHRPVRLALRLDPGEMVT